MINIDNNLINNPIIDKIVISFPKSQYNKNVLLDFKDDYNISTLNVYPFNDYISGYIFLIDQQAQGKVTYSKKDNRLYLTFNPSHLNSYQNRLIQMLLSNLSDKRFYRIDLAIDCYFNLLQSDIINKRVSDKITYTKRDKVTSLYFGKQSSGKCTVFYDKKRESPKKYSDYDIVHRLEIRLFSTQANNLLHSDFSKLLSSFSITKLDINDSLSLQKKALTTTQKLQVKEYINNLYGMEFTKQEKYKIKQLISKLRKTDYKPVFDDILKQSESTIKEQLQAFVSDIVEYKAVA